MDLIQTISENEFSFIAGLDYQQDRELHEAALRAVIETQGGHFTEGQYWFPYEVVELGANHLQQGHEREFVICTLLVIRAVVRGFDTATDLAEKKSVMDWQYRQLPEDLQAAVYAEYALAGHA